MPDDYQDLHGLQAQVDRSRSLNDARRDAEEQIRRTFDAVDLDTPAAAVIYVGAVLEAILVELRAGTSR